MKQTGFKEVFIFVAGTTPQIITETIYALNNQKPPIIPGAIHVISTQHGKILIQENLFHTGRFGHFCKEFNLSQNIFTEDSIIVVTDHEGKPLHDIRNKKDNECLGDFITNFVREKTRDQKTRLHCSLAGGRKTMSFYLGATMQLFGRPWDKLYHVLVTPEFESNPDFYYKPKKNRVLKKKDGKEIHTGDAQIFLAELPFIRLKDKIPNHQKSFQELVQDGQKEIDTALTQPLVRVNLRDRLVTIGTRDIEFKPFHLVLYAYLLKQKTERCPYPEKAYCLECTDCFTQINDLATPGITEVLAKDYGIIYGFHSGHVENFRRQWRDGIDLAKLRSDRSKINRDIIENLQDETLATYYTITSLRKYGATRFGVKVEKGKIGIE
jgi:CRISPR-associated protein (TIGR02584 family)